MSAIDASSADAPDATRGRAGRFVFYLASFAFPLLTLTYLLVGPLPWWLALLGPLPVAFVVWLDYISPTESAQPSVDAPAWAFDALLLLHAVLQLTNIVLLVVFCDRLAWWPWPELAKTLTNHVAVVFLVGTSSGYSAIIVAHELIHRRRPWLRQLGRAILVTVLYEHFSTEHIRGHHPRVGTPADPATARFGETLNDFVFRTIPAQFKSAWRLEKVRLGDADMTWRDPRMWRHRVLHGLLAEALLLIAIAYFGGLMGLFMFLGHVRMAIYLLETINYIEHWGIVRSGNKVGPVHAWDTTSRFTLFTTFGLSRHADHHLTASRPYQLLRHHDSSPKMPHGYLATFILADMFNDKYRAYAERELRRCGLAPPASPSSDRMTPAQAPVSADRFGLS
jgi:alkane 1-monooxygenase